MLFKYFEFINNTQVKDINILTYEVKIIDHEIIINAFKGKRKCGFIIISNITSSDEGWSEFDSELPYAVIEKIRVNPKLHGKGYGPLILQKGIDYIKNELHLYFIVLKPKGDGIPDEKLIKWYEKQGFKQKGNLMTMTL